MRLAAMALGLLLLTIAVRAMAPRAACLEVAGGKYLVALEGNQLHLCRVTDKGVVSLPSIIAEGITTLAVGRFDGKPVLLAARGKFLLRLDFSRRRWVMLGKLKAPICEIHPSPDGSSTAMVLTGSAGKPVPKDGALWWVSWKGKFTVSRVNAVKDYYRPWQFWWTRAAGEQRFAVATYKSTHFAPFEHNCMFIFGWNKRIAEPRWLGSRLTRPYVDATHADLRGDNKYRMIAIEVTKDGGRALSVYSQIGFGYENEWKTDAIEGLERIASYGDAVICWGHDADKKPIAWRLLPKGDAYALIPLSEAPPSVEAVARLGKSLLAGWWEGGWQIIALPD